MEELKVKSNSGQALGTAALITGIISFVLAVIPCLGILAVLPAVTTIILAAIGLTQTARDDSPRGLNTAGLIIGVIAFLIAISQAVVGGRLVKHADKFPSEIRDAIKEVKRDITDDLEKANINIRVESNGEVVEINTSSPRDEQKLRQLEDLEKGFREQADTLPPR